MGIEFTKHIIDDSFSSAYSVYAEDIDSDGDIDVIGCGFASDDVAWWENNGLQNFTKHDIDNSFIGACCAFAIDINLDGNIDILAAARGGDEIAWWENDGNENFSKHIIDDVFDGPKYVYATDVDSDSDIDILGVSSVVNDTEDVAWWENDGNENFSKHIIDDNFADASAIFAKDIDLDNDTDVLAVSRGYAEVAWWENDGNQNFIKHLIEDDFGGATSVYSTDVDLDGDNDVIGIAEFDEEVAWWENNGSQHFSKHSISVLFDNAFCVYAKDVDSDFDVDIIGAAWNGNEVAWWENEGDENFIKHTIDNHFNGARSVYAKDIDLDGDTDIIGAAQEHGDIAWWEQVGTPNLDAAWISSDSTGIPILLDLRSAIGDEVSLNVMLENEYYSAVSICYPIYYNPNVIELDSAYIDTTQFPNWTVWSFSSFVKDTLYNDSGKVLFYLSEPAGALYALPQGTHRIGALEFNIIDSGNTIIDTCFFPPAYHSIYYVDASYIEYFPRWSKVDVEIMYPEIEVQPDSLFISTSSPLFSDELLILNTSEVGILRVDSIQKSNDWSTIDSSGFYVFPPETEVVQFNVTSLGLIPGTYVDSLHIYSNDQDEPICKIPVIFEILPSDIATFPASLDFQYVGLGISENLELIVSNQGTGTLEIGTISIANPEFSIDSICTLIAPSNSDTAIITFNTSFVGTRIGTLTIYNNDPIDSLLNIPLSAFSVECGDANGNLSVTSADGYTILNFHGSGPQPVLCWASNVNGGSLTPADGYYLLNYLGGGAELNCQHCEFLDSGLIEDRARKER
jgi:hypothetical protein